MTATVYECPECEERMSDRRCPDCNLLTRRLGPGGHCPECDQTILITELTDNTGQQPAPTYTETLTSSFGWPEPAPGNGPGRHAGS